MRTILCLLLLSFTVHTEEPAKPTASEQAEIKKLLMPFFVSQSPSFKQFVIDSSASINVKLEDKKAAVLSFRVSIKTIDQALDGIIPGDD